MGENMIIMTDGSTIPLSQYQKENGLTQDQLSANFGKADTMLWCEEPFSYSIYLILLIQRFRERKKKPVRINSGFRTHKKQLALIKEGQRAASYSVHEKGLAVDIDTTSYKETLSDVDLILQIAKEMGIKIRVGYMDYWVKMKQTFFHVDVAPMYYAEGMPWHSIKHHPAWEYQQAW